MAFLVRERKRLSRIVALGLIAPLPEGHDKWCLCIRCDAVRTGVLSRYDQYNKLILRMADVPVARADIYPQLHTLAWTGFRMEQRQEANLLMMERYAREAQQQLKALTEDEIRDDYESFVEHAREDERIREEFRTVWAKRNEQEKHLAAYQASSIEAKAPPAATTERVVDLHADDFLKRIESMSPDELDRVAEAGEIQTATRPSVSGCVKINGRYISTQSVLTLLTSSYRLMVLAVSAALVVLSLMRDAIALAIIGVAAAVALETVMRDDRKENPEQ